MKNNEKSKRGGVRKGAGRPPMDGKARRVSVSLRVTASNGELMQRMKAAGLKLGMVLDEYIPAIAEKFGIKQDNY